MEFSLNPRVLLEVARLNTQVLLLVFLLLCYC